MKSRLIAAVTLSAILAACGSGGSVRSQNLDISRAVLAAADRTVAARSAKIAMTMDLGSVGTMTGGGAFDFRSRTGFLKMNITGLPGASGVFEVRFLKDVFYMRLPIPGLPADKPWLRMDLKALKKTTGVDLGAMMNGGAQDPTSSIEFLRAADHVKLLGSEPVRGANTKHYSATIDIRKALQRVPQSARGQLQALLDKAHLTTLPTEVWIDNDGRVRRVRTAFDASAFAPKEASGGLGEMKMTFEFYDFGTPVSVSVPPANQQIDFGRFMEQYKPH